LKGCTGTMVRSTSKGMAIHFDRDCYIITQVSHPIIGVDAFKTCVSESK